MLLRAVLAVLRIGIAGLAAHGARQLAAALVESRSPCSRSGGRDARRPAASGRSRCSSRTSGAAPWAPACRPGRRPADRRASRSRSSCSPRCGSGPRGRRSRRSRPCTRRTSGAADRWAGRWRRPGSARQRRPGPLLLAAVDAAADRAVLELAEDALALPAALRRQRAARPRARPASSCARRENTDVRVQPGTAQGTALSSSAASLRLAVGAQPVRRLAAWSRTPPSAAVDGPGPGAVAARAIAGRARRPSAFANFSRQGSHIDDAGSAGSAAPRPPSLAPLADAIEIQVRVHPGTEQGDDFAPRRSASVNPARPMMGAYADRNTARASASARRGDSRPPGPGRAAALAPGRSGEGRQARTFPMQITIEDISPVEKRVEFELPWADVAPKLDKAYDSLRRGVRLPGFRPGKVPAGACSRRCTSRQVEDEVARDLVEQSLGQAIQREPDPAGRAAHRRRAGDQVGRAVQVLGARRGPLAGDAQGLLRASPLTRRPAKVTDEQVAEALEGYRRRLTEFKPVEGRTADRRRPTWCWSSCHGQVGDHKLKKRAGGGRSRERRRAAAARPGQPPARQADRRRARSRSTTRSPPRAPPPELAGSTSHLHVTHQGGAREEGPGARRRDGQGHRRGRDARGPARQGARAAGSRPTSSASSAR